MLFKHVASNGKSRSTCGGDSANRMDDGVLGVLVISLSSPFLNISDKTSTFSVVIKLIKCAAMGFLGFNPLILSIWSTKYSEAVVKCILHISKTLFLINSFKFCLKSSSYCLRYIPQYMSCKQIP
eukprot:NODE_63_length_26141_cov_1.022656.p24 type:complete len:125 gc:universal NODE_63_length_26141_cov_1.022656:20926-21300(+)